MKERQKLTSTLFFVGDPHLPGLAMLPTVKPNREGEEPHALAMIISLVWPWLNPGGFSSNSPESSSIIQGFTSVSWNSGSWKTANNKRREKKKRGSDRENEACWGHRVVTLSLPATVQTHHLTLVAEERCSEDNGTHSKADTVLVNYQGLLCG